MMTLNLARNFLLLSFIHSASVLKELKALDDDELCRLHKSNHAEVAEIYKTAFRRIKERNQIEILERAVRNYL